MSRYLIPEPDFFTAHSNEMKRIVEEAGHSIKAFSDKVVEIDMLLRSKISSVGNNILNCEHKLRDFMYEESNTSQDNKLAGYDENTASQIAGIKKQLRIHQSYMDNLNNCRAIMSELIHASDELKAKANWLGSGAEKYGRAVQMAVEYYIRAK